MRSLEEPFDTAVRLIRGAKKDVLSGSDPIVTSTLGIRFDYEHDYNQFVKDVCNELKDEWKGNGLCLNIHGGPMPKLAEDMYSFIAHVYKREDENRIEPYLKLRDNEVMPLSITGIWDINSQTNQMISTLNKYMFMLGTGFSKSDYKCITLRWKNDVEGPDDCINQIIELAKDYGLKIYVHNNGRKSKFYIYQVMTPELETIIKRRSTFRLVK